MNTQIGLNSNALIDSSENTAPDTAFIGSNGQMQLQNNLYSIAMNQKLYSTAHYTNAMSQKVVMDK